MGVFLVVVDNKRDDDVRGALAALRGAPSANLLKLSEGAVLYARVDLPSTINDEYDAVEYLDHTDLSGK
jgi:hypothetical protein